MLRTYMVCILLFMVVVPLYAGRYYFDFPLVRCSYPQPLCVEIRKCPFFDALLNRTSKPRPRMVINIIKQNQCGFESNTPYVCCEAPTPISETTSELIPTTTTTVNSVSNTWTNSLIHHRNINLLPNSICGQISTNSRITAGTATELYEFPWMALIAYYKDDTLDFRCGGTVINERYVLTAAHCIIYSEIVGVRLGEHNLDTVVDCDEISGKCAPPPQDFYIQNMTVHPDYDPTSFANDIALIRLATPANFSSSNVQPICLPLGKMELTGREGIVTGWGITETGHKSKKLMKVSLPVLPISKCQTVYKNFAKLTQNQICAGGLNGKDSCAGDSGGPMQYLGIIDGTTKFLQYGIVSYGPKYCGTNGQPSIYIKVPNYMEWILDNLQPLDD